MEAREKVLDVLKRCMHGVGLEEAGGCEALRESLADELLNLLPGDEERPVQGWRFDLQSDLGSGEWHEAISLTAPEHLWRSKDRVRNVRPLYTSPVAEGAEDDDDEGADMTMLENLGGLTVGMTEMGTVGVWIQSGARVGVGDTVGEAIRVVRETFFSPAQNRRATMNEPNARESRARLLDRARKLASEIDSIFQDAEHWNRTHEGEAEIDPDPDGQLQVLRSRLGRLIIKEG